MKDYVTAKQRLNFKRKSWWKSRAAQQNKTA
jgi:hypothetical protein